MDDLVSYASGGVHAPLVQAALVHAQLETIHPYTDGNGRVGRALIHTVLTRRGLTPSAVLPVSLVLLTRSEEYLEGLTAYKAVEELADSGVVSRKKLDRGTVGYLARDVFDLLTFTERRLASTRWDTRDSPPSRPAPALPQR